MTSLHSFYETVRPTEKRPFDITEITDALMSEPLNLDIGQIIHTPATVIVKKTRDDYINDKIIKEIKNRFDVNVTCKMDMLVFS